MARRLQDMGINVDKLQHKYVVTQKLRKNSLHTTDEGYSNWIDLMYERILENIIEGKHHVVHGSSI